MAALFNFNAPTDRLWNFIRKPDSAVEEPDRPTIGLALSGGGAKGLAHIGVIQVLEEHGVTIDAVAGTSMGAYVGGCWAAGNDGHRLEEFAASVQTTRDLLSLVDPVIPRRGFVTGASIERRLRDTLGDITFEECERPLSIIATELESYAGAILNEGDVVSAIMASLAIPGIVTPYTRDGIEYIDGGVAEPLPVSPLVRAGVDKIIAVSVLPTVGEMIECRDLHRSQKNLSPFRKPFSWINSKINLLAHGNLLDIMRTSAMGSQMRLVQRDAKLADLLIRPVSCDARWHNYHHFAHYIRIGREAAQAALPEIESMLNPTKKHESTH